MKAESHNPFLNAVITALVIFLFIFIRGCGDKASWEEFRGPFLKGYQNKALGCSFSIDKDGGGAFLMISDADYQEYFTVDLDAAKNEKISFLNKKGKLQPTEFRDLIEKECIPAIQYLPTEGKKLFKLFFGEVYGNDVIQLQDTALQEKTEPD